jgi:DNA-directed RNA polymerase subunit F
MENDLHKLYENVKKKTFEESENEIIDYLKKYNKKIPEREK